MKNALSRYSSCLFGFFLFSILLLIYFPIVSSGPLLNRDDTLLLIPLQHIHSWQEYVSYFKSSTNLDLQPIRDFSFLVDIFLSRHLGWDTFHLQNMLIWFFCCLASYHLLLKLGSSALSARITIALMAVHPLYSGSISWVAARKHLLAFLFLIYWLNHFFSLKEKRKSTIQLLFPAILLFLFSIFSHPIYSLLPIWVFFYLAFQHKHNKWMEDNLNTLLFTNTVLLGIAILCQYLNIKHYEFIYQAIQEKPALTQALQLSAFTPTSDALLALGRYLYQIVVPWSYSTSYSKTSLKNIIGLVLIPLVIHVFNRLIGRRKSFEWTLFSFLMLAIVVFKIQVRLISDTYLLGASLGFWILVGMSVHHYSEVLIKRKYLVFSILLCAITFLSWRSHRAMKSWQSDFSLWENAFAVEPDCANSGIHATDLFKSNRIEEALQVAKAHIKNQCHEENSKSLFLLTSFYEPALSQAAKIDILLKVGQHSANGDILLSALYLDSKQQLKATAILDHLAPLLPTHPSDMQLSFVAPLKNSINTFCVSNPDYKYCFLGKESIH